MPLTVTAGVADLDPLVPAVRAVFQSLFRAFLQRARDRARRNASGAVLARRSGALAGSIQDRVEVQGLTLVGSLSSDVPYAAIQELGGVTPPHLIRPVRARVLRFEVGGETVFTRLVRHPGSRIPARPYLAPALRDEQPRLESDLDEGVRRLLASLARPKAL